MWYSFGVRRECPERYIKLVRMEFKGLRINICIHGSIYGIMPEWRDIVSKLDKLFSDIVNNPKDVRFEDIDKVLKY